MKMRGGLITEVKILNREKSNNIFDDIYERCIDEILRVLYPSPEIKGMTVYEFLDYVDDNPSKLIKYCEIVLDENGLIYLANPCHIEFMYYYCAKKYGVSKEEYIDTIPTFESPSDWIVEKEKLIPVWYNYFIGNPNRFQRKVLQILHNKGIVSFDQNLCEIVFLKKPSNKGNR